VSSGCDKETNMARRGPKDGIPTWTPNQVVAANLNRLRQRRGLTQAEAARKLSEVAGKPWTEAMMAHAERSVTGNRIREFTADDLVTMARAFDVPVLYFLTPPPGIFISVPDSQAYGVTTLTMLEAVLGRLDNLAEWEALLDEWDFVDDDQLPFPHSQQSRQELKAVAREVSLVRAQHVIRHHFKGDLAQLQETLRSLADLVQTVNNHEVLAELDEDDYIRRINQVRRVAEKGRRLIQAKKDLEITAERQDDAS
jgi:transcriptional regulator with XRE-family HTH domain